ncbi:phosphatase PAP2 family protein [uncultured Bradyrhizobium sp.]|jgi:membrane-associated phospholipid phosphatase|uniref:phosphatase PAP2 family protein n=1 Tax=uncultured Bradyrhizobium sp. TaxID=199684 RepID=UPI00261E6A65|nr:phosphatase PAP2 family protein [uncultured Bradyrhizobium sp.]
MAEADDQREAWRLYGVNWIPLTAMGAVLAGALALSHFSVAIDTDLVTSLIMTAGLVISGRYLILRAWGTRSAFVLLAIAQLTVLGLFGAPLTYIAASANLPLQDANLAHLDKLLWLDWPAYYDFFVTRPVLLQYAVLFYAMILSPTLTVPIVLGFSKNYVRLQRFVLACTLTVCVTALVSALVPAIGTYQQYGLPADSEGFKAMGYLIQLERLPLARDGSLRVLELSQISGIVTFPSFHAAAAMLALWGFWAVWWLRPLALILNGGMLIATPLIGGHYFVDVFAGVALAALSIYATERRRRGKLATQGESTSSARAYPVPAKSEIV